ncbi:MAG: hypothetical protein ACI91G_000695 [Gammaproteobacteria bacterium]|jgi:hypothetical protein
MRFLLALYKQEVKMTDNIYAAPEAGVSDTNKETAPPPAQFYVVSQRKFLTLYIATFGLYAIYWHYKNWAYQKAALNLDIWPVARGLFNVFFVHALFSTAGDRVFGGGKVWTWNSSRLATGWVALWLTDRILNSLAQSGAISAAASMLGVIAMPLMAYIAYQAQCAFNTAENDPYGERNSQFSSVNRVWIALGLLLWTLSAVGAYATLTAT